MIPDTPLNREREIFEQAIELGSASERQAFLKSACGADAAMLERLEGLLTAHERAEGFLPPQAAAASGPGGTVIAPVTEKAGDRIGRYKLLQQIGEGGCGVVYMAEQEEPVRRRVALKVIKVGMDTKQVVARFEAERQALAMMDHPNIAKVLDAGATDTGRPFFVMELVRGTKLTEFCDAQKLPTRERLDLFLQVCSAIQHAHQKGIIHRDLKPSNLLVTIIDGRPVPKVIDFGIAKATNQQRLTDKTLFTAFEQFIGTPAYMSPEQAEMSGVDIDTRSDIYSLGVVLYELLTGEPPFDPERLHHAGLDEIRRTIREEEPLKPSTRLNTLGAKEAETVAARRQVALPALLKVVRGDLDWIVMKCLEKDRARRYETASSIAQDIQRHLNSEPITARQPGAAYLFQRFIRRHRIAFGAGAAVAASLIIGLSVSTRLFFQEKAARTRAVEAEQAQARLRDQAERTSSENRLLADERRGQLIRSHVANGLRLMDDSLYLSSLPWLAEALKLNQGEPARERADRVRIDAVLAQCPRLVQFWALKDRTVDAVFSPDATRVVMVSPDNTAELMNPVTGEKVGSSLRHEGSIQTICFSPNGRTILTASYDFTARLWDGFTGQPLLPLQHTNKVSKAVFSPDGTRVLTGCADGTARVWDAATGKLLLSLPHGSDFSRTPGFFVFDVGYSRDGKRIVTGSLTAKIWDATTGQMIGQIDQRDALLTVQGQTAYIRHAEFSADGNLIMTEWGSGDSRGGVRIYDANTLKLLSSPRWLKNFGDDKWQLVSSAVLSSDGRRVAITYDDHSARIYDARTGSPVTPYLANAGNIASFSPDGRRLLTAGRESSAGSSGLLKIWNAESGQPLGSPLRFPAPVSCAEFSPDGSKILIGSEDRTARLWDFSVPERSAGPADALHAMMKMPAPFASRRAILSGTTAIKSNETALSIYSFPSTKPTVLQTPDPISAAFFFDTTRLATASPKGMVRVWDWKKSKQVGRDLAADSAVVHGWLTKSEEKFITTTGDGRLRLWDLQSGRPLTAEVNLGQKLQINPHTAEWGAVAYVPNDNSRLLTLWMAANDRFDLCLRELPSGNILLTNRLSVGGIHALKISPDERKFVVNVGQNLFVFDFATGKQTLQLANLQCVDVFGGRLLTVSNETAQVWDLETGKPVLPPLRHNSKVKDGGFSRDGKYILTSRLWDAATGEPLSANLKGFAHGGFTKDSRWIFGVDLDAESSASYFVGLWDPGTGESLTPHLKATMTTTTVRFPAYTWNLLGADPIDPPMKSWPANDLVSLCQFLSGNQLDKSGNLAALSQEESARAWQDLRSKYPGEFAMPSAEEMISWHEQEAQIAEFETNHFGAAFHVDRLRTLKPDGAFRHPAASPISYGQEKTGQ